MGSHLAGQKIRASTLNAETMTVAISGSRPVSPSTGQIIFETDTGLFAVWTGSAWCYLVTEVGQPLVLAAPQASVTFNPPSSVNHLMIKWHARTTSGNTSDNMQLRFNGDSASNYDWQIMAGLNATVSTTPGLGDTKILAGTVVGGTGSAGFFGCGEIEVPGWSQGANGHTATATGKWYACWSNSAATSQVGTMGALYTPSAAMTSATLSPAAGSFAAGSVFSMYALG
jgi:hypothetical protein